jgi:hypothetical protein
LLCFDCYLPLSLFFFDTLLILLVLTWVENPEPWDTGCCYAIQNWSSIPIFKCVLLFIPWSVWYWFFYCFLFTWWRCLFRSQFWFSTIWRVTEWNNSGILAMFLNVLKILWFYMIEIQCNQLTRVLDNITQLHKR